jgi:hypothetical protein
VLTDKSNFEFLFQAASFLGSSCTIGIATAGTIFCTGGYACTFNPVNMLEFVELAAKGSFEFWAT